MSEGYEIELLLEVSAMLFHLGRNLGKQSDAAPTRHLLGQATQITDGDLLRQSLKQLGLAYKEGDPEHLWGGESDVQVIDEAGRPWFALAWDDDADAYVIYRQDPAHAQEHLPPELRLSERDPSPVLARLAQQYGYLKTLRALLQEGYETQGVTERRADGAQVLVLQRHDPARDETHTVRLVFKANEGQATILTDSRTPDGQHGVCPDVASTLHAMGIEQYEKWTAPVAGQSGGKARSGRGARADADREGQAGRRKQGRA